MNVSPHVSKWSRIAVSALVVAPLLGAMPARADQASAPSAARLATPVPGQSYQFVDWRDQQLGGRWKRGGDDWRWRNRGWRHGGLDRGARWDRGDWRGHRYGYYRHGWRGDDVGGALAGGVVGLAAGALISGALVNRAPSYGPSYGAVESCSARFRSYDPRSGTYLGYDGRRHACP